MINFNKENKKTITLERGSFKMPNNFYGCYPGPVIHVDTKTVGDEDEVKENENTGEGDDDKTKDNKTKNDW